METRKRKVDRSLSRRHRVPAPVIKEAFETGSKFVGRLMVLWLTKNSDAALRLGVVSGKRTFRRAVDRTKARRRLREAYRRNRHRFCGKFDVVLVARKRILDTASREIEAELISLVDKAGILE